MTPLDPLAPVIVVPLLIAVGEMAKRLGVPSPGVAPLLCALGLALTLGEQLQVGGHDWIGAVLTGLALGLAAAGLYSGAKAAVNGRSAGG